MAANQINYSNYMIPNESSESDIDPQIIADAEAIKQLINYYLTIRDLLKNI